MRAIAHLYLCLDESLFSLLAMSSEIESGKASDTISIPTYSNLLLDENDLPLTTPSHNEQRRSVLLIADCDPHF